MDQTCKNDSRPVYAKGLCQPCYDRDKSTTRDYRKSECRNGHPFVAGSFTLSSTGKRLCAVCKEENKKTHCVNGHEYTPENTYWYKGYRACKTCRSERVAETRTPGVGQGGHNKAKTHCPVGHEYNEANTRHSTDGKRRYCHACALANSRIQRIKDHGVDIESFDALLEAQGGCCAVCENRIDEKSGRAIDHDHSCCPGITSCGLCVRGVLCKACNIALGFMQDSPERLRAAASYLENYTRQ